MGKLGRYRSRRTLCSPPLGNTQISISNSENDLKTGRTNSTRKEAIPKKVGRAKIQFENKMDCVYLQLGGSQWYKEG